MKLDRLLPTPKHYLVLGNSTLATSFMVIVASILMAYPYAERFTLGTQIAAHLITPIAAGFFKLGYVVRLAAHEAIEQP